MANQHDQHRKRGVRAGKTDLSGGDYVAGIRADAQRRFAAEKERAMSENEGLSPREIKLRAARLLPAAEQAVAIQPEWVAPSDLRRYRSYVSDLDLLLGASEPFIAANIATASEVLRCAGASVDRLHKSGHLWDPCWPVVPHATRK